MLRIGLTGGIGSGKSTVCCLFAALGVPIIDADQVSRSIVEPGQPALQEIHAHFGDTVLTADGQLDRARLRSLIFTDKEQRKILESILHPRIRQQMLHLASACQGPYLIFAIPLLLESGWQHLVDRILVVDCPIELQISRSSERDGVTNTQIASIIATQVERSTRLSQADEIIDNSRDLAYLQRQVEQLHQHYLTLAQEA